MTRSVRETLSSVEKSYGSRDGGGATKRLSQVSLVFSVRGETAGFKGHSPSPERGRSGTNGDVTNQVTKKAGRTSRARIRAPRGADGPTVPVESEANEHPQTGSRHERRSTLGQASTSQRRIFSTKEDPQSKRRRKGRARLIPCVPAASF